MVGGRSYTPHTARRLCVRRLGPGDQTVMPLPQSFGGLIAPASKSADISPDGKFRVVGDLERRCCRSAKPWFFVVVASGLGRRLVAAHLSPLRPFCHAGGRRPVIPAY